jgi:aminobenzoyl-glutamate transport protein
MSDETPKPADAGAKPDPQPASQGGPASAPPPAARGWATKALDWIEWAGNKLPDPAVLFVICLAVTCIISAILAPIEFSDIDPSTRKVDALGNVQSEGEPIRIRNQLSGQALVTLLSRMVKTFTDFAPLGVVLVAMLGVGVADHTGLINALIKGLLGFTPARLLTPTVLLVAILSHSAGDTGYVLVIPLGGVIFAAAGRHPLAGIAAAFAGVSGGFSANFLPSALDPLLQGFTQTAVQVIQPDRTVNPLCNLAFTATSCLLIIGAGWYITERVVEPKLRGLAVDGDDAEAPRLEALTPAERRGVICGLAAMVIGLAALAAVAWPASSPLRWPAGSLSLQEFTAAAARAYPADQYPQQARSAEEWASLFRGLDADGAEKPDKDRQLLFSEVPADQQALIGRIFDVANKPRYASLTDHNAPMMKAIVPFIFLMFLIPGIAYGYVAGTVKSHRDIVKGMSKAMSTMGYYLVLAFFAAQFTFVFGESKLGALLAIKGAAFLQWLGMPMQVTIVGIILLTAFVNLFIGSASAKWALLGPIFVPMLMQLGISPELTQAAYRIGDSSTNIITPLMPYFPLIVVYCQRYVTRTGIGTLVSLMVPYSLTFLVTWTVLLMVYWGLGIPLGLQATYTYPP